MAEFALVFDCDGTLIDTQGAWDAVESELERAAGYTMTSADKSLLCEFTVDETAAFFAEKSGSEVCAADLRAHIDAFILSYLKTTPCARPGALEFVRAAYATNVPLLVASSSARSYLKAGLETNGFMPYLQGYLSVEDLGTSKREPYIYEESFRLMNAQDSEQKWVFEDSLYALETLKRTAFKRCGVYDNDRAGAFADLKRESELAIHSWEDPALAQVFAFLQQAGV